MSLHVQLSEEAAAKLRSQKRVSTISSVIVSMLAIVLVGLCLGLFLLPSIEEEASVIVAYKGVVADEEKPQQEKTKSKIQKKPTAPAKAQNRVIFTDSASSVSIPTVDVSVDVEVLDFGAGTDFGYDWGADFNMDSAGGATTFFQQEVKAERIAFVIDYSGSMRGVKDKLMREELSKSLSSLPPGTKYQLIFSRGQLGLVEMKLPS